jgi:hypothetical protein
VALAQGVALLCSVFFTSGIAKVVVERRLLLVLLQRHLHIVEAGLPVDGDRGSRAAGHVGVRRRGAVCARVCAIVGPECGCRGGRGRDGAGGRCGVQKSSGRDGVGAGKWRKKETEIEEGRVQVRSSRLGGGGRVGVVVCEAQRKGHDWEAGAVQGQRGRREEKWQGQSARLYVCGTGRRRGLSLDGRNCTRH